MNSLRRASHKARAVHQALGIRSASDLAHLVEICVARGAFVREEKMDGASARLVVQNGKGLISVTPTRNPGRRRFSIAHELGHFEIHREGQSLWSCTDQDLSAFSDDSEEKTQSVLCANSHSDDDPVPAPIPPDPRRRRSQQEKEANVFAAELLMPEKILRAALPRGRPQLQMIQTLAQQFGVSWLAMAYRVFDILSEPCLMIVRPSDTQPTLLRTSAFRRASGFQILERPSETSGKLSSWVRFSQDDAPDSLVCVESQVKSQTGTQIDLIWAPEFSA